MKWSLNEEETKSQMFNQEQRTGYMSCGMELYVVMSVLCWPYPPRFLYGQGWKTVLARLESKRGNEKRK